MDKTTYPWRGLFVGAGLCAALAAIEPHVKMRLHTNGLCTDYINAGAVLFLFLLALALGPLRALTGRKWLDVPDLAVVFAMLAVACTIPSHGLLAPLLTLVTGASYYATPHNHFEEWILQRLPDWLLVRGEAARFFYEKLPPSEPFPVSAWIQPAIAWTILIAAVFLAQISLAALFYEPWARHERLAFPLVRLPAEMVRSAEDRGSRRPGHLLRDPIFWAGVALTFFIAGSRGLAFYHPETPTLPKISSWLAFFNGTTRILVTFSFVIVGFSYLLNTRVLLSIWFFHLLMKVVSGALILHGVALEGENEPWGGSTLLATHLNGGSMIALVLFGVWTAREHLARVLRDAWRGGGAHGPRWACAGLAAGLAVTTGWLAAAGVPLAVAPLAVALAFITLIGMTRIVAQAGVGFMCGGMPPAVQVASLLGTQPLGERGIPALASLYSWSFECRTTVMASATGSFRLFDLTRTGRVVLPLAAAIAITLSVSSLCMVRMAYREGGSNLRPNWFRDFAHVPWDIAVRKIRSPITAEMAGERRVTLAAGASVMGVLILLTQRWSGFPLHYIGFPIADIWMMNGIWASVLVAWAAKVIVLRYGGARAYTRSIAFALGLILGQILAAAAFMAADSVTGRVGHFMDVGLG